MKYFITLFISIIYLPSMACEIKNDEFKLAYILKDNILTYQIERIDYKPFYHYQEPYYGVQPSEIGIAFKEYNSIFLSKKDFYSYPIYSSYLYRGMVSQISLEGDKLSLKFFKLERKYEGSIDMDEFIESLRAKMPENYRYGSQNMTVHFNFFLDEDMSTCLRLKTKKIDYDFGNRYILEIKKKLKEFKPKSKEIPTKVT